MAWGCVSGYWTQPCQQCPCLENSTNVQSHDTALLGVPKKSKTLSCHSKTGKVGPKNFKQEDKPQVSSISCASVKNMVPTCSSVLPEVPELDREVKTDEYKNKKKSCYFQASTLIQCWWTESLKITGSLCWEHPQVVFSLQIFRFSRRGVFMYSGTTKKSTARTMFTAGEDDS